MSEKAQENRKETLQELVNLRNKVIGDLEAGKKLLSEIEAAIASNFPEEKSAIPVKPVVGIENLGKAGTGIPRLDDLMNGGFPLSSNILLSGPPYSSKMVVANRFIASSLSGGCPTIIVSLDRDLRSLRESLQSVGVNIQSYEQNGMLKFVDAYSRNIQMDSGDRNAAVIENAANMSLFLKTMDSLCNSVVSTSGKYRMVFFSLTAWITQSSDDKNFTKAFQHFSQRRKMEGATTLYLIEDGIFEKSMYENMNYFMDGSLEFRHEGSTEYMRVRGLRNVRSRDWIEVINSGDNLSLGSFELKRIR